MRMPASIWIGPSVNRTPGGEKLVYGLVLHIQQGNEQGTEAWQRNPASQVSSHFLAPKTGGIRQMVDTADKAWCEVDGNSHWLSVECEGYSGQSLTDVQVDAVAHIMAWMYQAYSTPLRKATTPTPNLIMNGGLAWHSLGGAAWGGHLDCPGQPIIDQIPAILARARELLGLPATNPPPPVTEVTLTITLPILGQGATGEPVKRLQGLLNAAGAMLVMDGAFGPLTAGSVTHYQYTHGLAADGVVGEHTWTSLLTA